MSEIFEERDVMLEQGVVMPEGAMVINRLAAAVEQQRKEIVALREALLQWVDWCESDAGPLAVPFVDGELGEWPNREYTWDQMVRAIQEWDGAEWLALSGLGDMLDDTVKGDVLRYREALRVLGRGSSACI